MCVMENTYTAEFKKDNLTDRLKGESPATMAFEPLTKTDLLVSKATAKAIGVTLPEDLIKRANKVVS